MRLTFPFVVAVIFTAVGSQSSGQLIQGAGGRSAQTVSATLIVSGETPDVNMISAFLRHAVSDNPELHGAWIDVDFDDENDLGVAPGRFIFRRQITDSRNHARQTAILQSLIKSLLPAGNYSFDASQNQMLPFSDLMEALSEQLALDYKLRGCRLDGGYYESSEADDSKLNLVLLGRVRLGEQLDPATEIERRCASLMRQNPSWISGKLSSAKVDSSDSLNGLELLIAPSSVKLREVPGSFNRAVTYYESGRKAFFAGDIHSAKSDFSMAALEEPNDQLFRYWIALCDLSLGDRRRAEKNVVVAKRIETRGQSYFNSGVDLSMRRIQGRLRLELRDMMRTAATQAAFEQAKTSP